MNKSGLDWTGLDWSRKLIKEINCYTINISDVNH